MELADIEFVAYAMKISNHDELRNPETSPLGQAHLVDASRASAGAGGAAHWEAHARAVLLQSSNKQLLKKAMYLCKRVRLGSWAER